MAATIRIIIEQSSDGDALKATVADVERLGKTAKDSGGGFASLREIGVGALREIGSLAVDALGKAAQAVGGFLRDSIAVAGDFEAGMNNFKAVIGDAVDTKGLDQFKSLFISLGKELPVSTSEVQAAAIEMVKGGIDPATIAAGGLRQNLQFAAAAGLSLEDAATVSAKVLGGWTAQAATAADKAAFLTAATDTLTKAANASTVDVQDLALGLYNVQGTAKTTGLSLQETVTALSELAPRFSSANTAGTSFRNFLIRLQPTTKPAIAAMSDLGLMTTSTTKLMAFLGERGIQPLGTDLDTLGNQFTEFAAKEGWTTKETQKVWESFAQSKFFDEASGKFIGVAQSSQLLHDALAGLTDAQRVQALQTIFGNDAMNAAAALAEVGAQGYSDMADAMNTAAGVQQNATTKQQGFNIALDNAKGSVEALQITVGSYLLPILTELLNNVLAPAVNTLTNLADAAFGNQEAFGQLSPTLQTILLTLQSWQPTAMAVVGILQGALTTAVQFVTAHWDAFKGALIAVGAVLAGAAVAGALISIAGTLAMLANPITLVIGAVALLGAAWSSNFLGIQTTLTTFWTGTAQPILAQLVTWLQTNLPPAIAAVSAFFTTTLLPAAQAVWSFFQSNILPILQTLATVYIAMVKAELQALAGFFTGVLLPAARAAWAFFKDSLLPLLQALASVYIALVKKEVQALAGLWQSTLLPALQAVGGLITGTVVPAFQTTATTISGVVGPALQSFESWLGAATGGINGIVGAIKSVIGWLSDLANKLDSLSLPDWLTPGSPTPWEIGLRGIASAMGALNSGPLTDFAKHLRTIDGIVPDVGTRLPPKLGFAPAHGIAPVNTVGRSYYDPRAVGMAEALGLGGGRHVTATNTRTVHVNYAPTYGNAPAHEIDLAHLTAMVGAMA